MDIERIITTAIQHGITIGCAQTMKVLGVTSGELTENKASDLYGKWFREAIKRGDIKPCRVGDGNHGTHWYNIEDILTYKARKEIKAQLTI